MPEDLCNAHAEDEESHMRREIDTQSDAIVDRAEVGGLGALGARVVRVWSVAVRGPGALGARMAGPPRVGVRGPRAVVARVDRPRIVAVSGAGAPVLRPRGAIARAVHAALVVGL